MDFGRFRFFVREVFANLSRNAGMQFTAIGTVAVTIVLLGSLLFVRESVSRIGAQVLSQIEISAYLTDASTDDTAAQLRHLMSQDSRITRITYIPKSVGFAEMRTHMEGQIDTSLMTSNPLPNAFRIQVRRPQSVAGVAARLQRLPGIAKVTYAQDIVLKLLRVTEVIERVGIGMIVVLLLVAAIIISNTIRLTVFARRREIAIMQLVGATASYIRAPFIVEGFIDGLVGAAVAVGILAGAQAELLPKLFAAMPFVPMAHAGVDEHQIVLQLLCTGAALGTLASWVALGRYLRT